MFTDGIVTNVSFYRWRRLRKLVLPAARALPMATVAVQKITTIVAVKWKCRVREATVPKVHSCVVILFVFFGFSEFQLVGYARHWTLSVCLTLSTYPVSICRTYLYRAEAHIGDDEGLHAEHAPYPGERHPAAHSAEG